jgi:hypothetical protein
MVRAAIDDIEGGQAFEQLWTERTGEDLFKVCCIPSFAYDLALGDLVRADAGTDYLIQSVAQRSGNGVARVAIKRREDVDAIHPQLHDVLGRLEYLCEWLEPGYVAVNLEPARSHDELFNGLGRARGPRGGRTTPPLTPPHLAFADLARVAIPLRCE